MSSREDFWKKYEGFSKDLVVRFVVTNHFKEDYVLEQLEKLSEGKDKDNFFYTPFMSMMRISHAFMNKRLSDITEFI